MSSRSRSQSRFMRSMTPSGSVKMSTSRFNLVCGRPVEAAITPNLDHLPTLKGPKIIDARVTTPMSSRKEMSTMRQREPSLTRDAKRPPPPPPRDSSLYLPFGSYADRGCHTKAPSRYSAAVSNTLSIYNKNVERSRKSMTPMSTAPPMTSAHFVAYPWSAAGKRF